jgi:hypothetical protein
MTHPRGSGRNPSIERSLREFVVIMRSVWVNLICYTALVLVLAALLTASEALFKMSFHAHWGHLMGYVTSTLSQCVNLRAIMIHLL